jgi:hypothetical protein
VAARFLRLLRARASLELTSCRTGQLLAILSEIQKKKSLGIELKVENVYLVNKKR